MFSWENIFVIAIVMSLLWVKMWLRTPPSYPMLCFVPPRILYQCCQMESFAHTLKSNSSPLFTNVSKLIINSWSSLQFLSLKGTFMLEQSGEFTKISYHISGLSFQTNSCYFISQLMPPRSLFSIATAHFFPYLYSRAHHLLPHWRHHTRMSPYIVQIILAREYTKLSSVKRKKTGLELDEQVLSVRSGFDNGSKKTINLGYFKFLPGN